MPTSSSGLRRYGAPSRWNRFVLVLLATACTAGGWFLWCGGHGPDDASRAASVGTINLYDVYLHEPAFAEVEAEPTQGIGAATLLRVVQADVRPDPKSAKKALFAAPWGALYRVCVDDYVAPHFRFDRYEPGAALPHGEVALSPEEVKDPYNDERMDSRIRFSKVEPRAYIMPSLSNEDYAGCVVSWDADRNEQLHSWCGETDYVEGLVVSPDERLVGVHYFWQGNPGADGITMETEGWSAWFGGFRTAIGCWTFNHTNTRMLVSTVDGIDCLADLPSLTVEDDVPWSEEDSIVSRDNGWETSRLSGSEGTRLVRLETGSTDSVEHAVFSPDDAVLAVVVTGNTIQFFDGRSGKAVGHPCVLDVEIEELLYASDGRHVLARTESGKVYNVRSPSGKQAYPPLVHGVELLGMRLTSDGRTLLTWGSDCLCAWRIDDGKEIFPAITLPESIADAYFPASAPGCVALWSRAGVAQIFDLVTGQARSGLIRHGGQMDGVTLCGEYWITWDRKGTIKEWRLSSSIRREENAES